MSNVIGFRTFDSNKQTRLDTLLTKNSSGKLTSAEKDELQLLVHETEEMTLAHASLLVAAVLEGRTPLEALKAGETARVVDQAWAVGAVA